MCPCAVGTSKTVSLRRVNTPSVLAILFIPTRCTPPQLLCFDDTLRGLCNPTWCKTGVMCDAGASPAA